MNKVLSLWAVCAGVSGRSIPEGNFDEIAKQTLILIFWTVAVCHTSLTILYE